VVATLWRRTASCRGREGAPAIRARPRHGALTHWASFDDPSHVSCMMVIRTRSWRTYSQPAIGLASERTQEDRAFAVY